MTLHIGWWKASDGSEWYVDFASPYESCGHDTNKLTATWITASGISHNPSHPNLVKFIGPKCLARADMEHVGVIYICQKPRGHDGDHECLSKKFVLFDGNQPVNSQKEK